MTLSCYALRRGPPWPVELAIDLECDRDHGLLAAPILTGVGVRQGEDIQQTARRMGWSIDSNQQVVCPECRGRQATTESKADP